MPKFKYIDLDDTFIDPEVQRLEDVSEPRVRGIVDKFDPVSLGVLHVHVRAGGRYAMIDGRHRKEAARRVGYNRRVGALVYEGLSIPEQKKLFDELNTASKVSTITHFAMRVGYGEPVAVEINKVLNHYGWTVAPGAGEGRFAAVNAAESVYYNGANSVELGEHLDLLDRTVATITAAWGLDSRGMHQVIVKGLGKFFGRYLVEKIDQSKVVTELQLLGAATLRGRAAVLKDAQGGTVDAAVAAVITGRYNNRKRSNLLPEWVWSR